MRSEAEYAGRGSSSAIPALRCFMSTGHPIVMGLAVPVRKGTMTSQGMTRIRPETVLIVRIMASDQLVIA